MAGGPISPIVQGGDFGSAWVERSEIYDLVRDAKITGFAIVSGDLHSFWAGYASAQLPPRKFEPVGLSFVGGSHVERRGDAKRTSTAIKKDQSTSGRSTSPTGRARRSPTGPTT